MRYSTAYHPQTQGVVERMNAVVSQMLRCLIHDLIDIRNWQELLPIAKLAINSFPNRSTGFSPFYLNFGFHPVVPADLLKGNEVTNFESVNSFVERLRTVWDSSIKRIKHAQELQA